MNIRRSIAALTLALLLGAGVLAGCSGESDSDGWSGNDGITEGAAPLMPPTHEGRYESLGAAGCYGCHGANEDANPMLAAAVALPDDHYEDSDPTTLTLDGTHGLCNTCHVQG